VDGGVPVTKERNHRSRGVGLGLFYCVTLSSSYLLSFLLYPTTLRGLETSSYFGPTYFGCIGASMVLSLLAPLLRSTGWIHFALLLRCYVLVVFGYGLGPFIPGKLILEMGLVVEACVLEYPPFDLGIVSAIVLVLVAVQACPDLLGSTSLVSNVERASPAEIGAAAFILLFSAYVALRIRRLEKHRRDAVDLARIQETNLDTLTELNRNLQGYARTVEEESAERERIRISREIHDIVGYIFTNLIALMDAAGSLAQGNRTELAELIFSARGQAQEGLRETRQALRRLRDQQTPVADCTREIHRIVTIFHKVTKVHTEVSFGNLPHVLPTDFSRTLYRTVQEALTNAVRHGKATSVKISFWVEGGELRLSILDNGRGAFEIVKGIGLSGMEERVGGLGGTIRFGKAAEGGFVLWIVIPMPRGLTEEARR